ncbi:DEAD/DEAH box helicase [Corynebacterium pelargi]|uniref:ATP-dependent helicase HepA n=1 Tax=Corynebacterium pelargi TaxID=1471400 RepID=A0A410W9J7_9CORY|nr:DEAD/DEAH box helicase [Corynebacterium pelargi]QAU52619.1 ATP-dependent helicase HepA [Corynebacterium pelargi]GGG77707.1 helicase [Corynebacterium pelargi]
MPEYLLHGLWSNDVGLMLWIEQVEGHKILSADAVPEDAFPPSVYALIKGRRAHLHPVTLMTPKGRSVNIAKLPTVAFTPEQTVKALATIAGLRSTASSEEERATIAPDLWWMVRCFEGLEQFVRAGRLSIKLAFREKRWWPQWTLATGLNERGWIAQMTAAAPGVLVRNAGSTVAEDMADILPHWIAHALLKDLDKRPRPHEWHAFSRALLRSESLHRANPQLLHAIGDWRNSVLNSKLELVVLIEEPEEEAQESSDLGLALWPIKIMVRSGVDSPQPLLLREHDREVVAFLREQYQKMLKLSPVLDYRRELPAGTHMVYSQSTVGDWDSAITTDELARFVQHDVEKLSRAGITVLLPKAWTARKEQAKASVRVAGGPLISKFGFEQIVSYDWKVSVGDTELDEAQMRELVRSKSGLLRIDGQWVVADTAQVARIQQYITDLQENSKRMLRRRADEARMKAELAKLHQDPDWEELAAEAAELEELAQNPNAGLEASDIQELRKIAMQQQDQLVEFRGDPWYQELLGVVDGEKAPAPQRVALPDTVHATLREYQRRGVDWLYWMASNRIGAVLADDMGLGKTLQLLSLEAIEIAQSKDVAGTRKPTLVVAPTSVVGNWAKEAHRFVPSIKVLVLHGSSRPRADALFKAVEQADVVITSYGVLQREATDLAKVRWGRVVLDEAQAIKNASTKASRSARALPADHRIALTGTPIENKLAELHSILDFANPGVLGSASFFRNHFARAIERYNDDETAERLRGLSAPFILRRLKSDPSIIDDLPEKHEEVITVRLSAEQAALYEAFVHGVEGQLSGGSSIEDRGKVLAAITKIKQICNHPAHFLGDHSAITYRGRHRSGKVEKLMEILSEARMAEEKALIFTQYTTFGEMLVPYLEEFYGETIPFLHGGVSKAGRDRMVEQFQSPDGPPVMILSLRAGGTGLNLTAANVVVHMDRWWNPAVENQATDRAYRIGQGRNVRVHKLLAQGTLEEAINDVIIGKIHLANAVVGAGEGWLTELEPEQLIELMRFRGREE